MSGHGQVKNTNEIKYLQVKRDNLPPPVKNKTRTESRATQPSPSRSIVPRLLQTIKGPVYYFLVDFLKLYMFLL